MSVVPSLSVVVPIYNEPVAIGRTVDALDRAVAASAFEDVELIIVDDGSDEPTRQALAALRPAHLRVRTIHQENAGRFEARRTGIRAATGEQVLLVDARTTVAPDSLAWVADRVAAGELAWNGHCMIANATHPLARFWNVMTHAAFADYLADPRTTSFGIEEYDRFPKGTTHFLAPRAWLLDAIDGFSSRYEDTRHANDDTVLLRAIAERDRIHISPHFASTYEARESLRRFLSHGLHRGVVFFDGFSRPGNRFFPVVVAAFPLSLGGTALLLTRPRLALLGAGAMATAGASVAVRAKRPPGDVASFGALVVPFAVVYALGIWQGLGLAVRRRLTGRGAPA